MAHHLAELITISESAEGKEKQKAEDRAAELILKLWTNRRVLPVPADPLYGYVDAIEVLSAMLPSANPWRRFQRHNREEVLLSDMFGTMAHLILSGLLLTSAQEVRRVENAEWDALSDEERFVVDALERWRCFAVTPAPNAASLEAFLATIEGDNEGGLENEHQLAQEEAHSEQDPRNEILSHIATFQKQLNDLMELWRKAGGLGETSTTSDDDH